MDHVQYVPKGIAASAGRMLKATGYLMHSSKPTIMIIRVKKQIPYPRLPSRRKSQGRGSVAEIAPHLKLWPAEGYHQQCLKKGGCMGQNGARPRYAPSRCCGC
ncbi:TPA: hypothetical protein ACH3X2_007758 [Trebouxia sp. C0005]